MLYILPFLSTCCIFTSAVLVAIGWSQIIKGRKEAHKELMLWGAFFALAFFILYVSKTVLLGSMTFGGPDGLKLYYLIFLMFHIILATVAAVFGLTTIFLAFTERFSKHRKLGRITASIWFVSASSGIVVYLLLYILYPGGETAGLLDAIIGK